MEAILPQTYGLSAIETQSAVNDGLNNYQTYQNPAISSFVDVTMRGGRAIQNWKSFSANATSETINVFEFSGSIIVHKLYAVVQATALGNHTGAYFDAYGTSAIDLTEGATGANLSNMSQGAIFHATGDSTVAINLTDNPASNPVYSEGDIQPTAAFKLSAEVGATNYIRYTYTTTDAPTQGEVYFYIVYTPISDFDWVVAAF